MFHPVISQSSCTHAQKHSQCFYLRSYLYYAQYLFVFSYIAVSLKLFGVLKKGVKKDAFMQHRTQPWCTWLRVEFCQVWPSRSSELTILSFHNGWEKKMSIAVPSLYSRWAQHEWSLPMGVLRFQSFWSNQRKVPFLFSTTLFHREQRKRVIPSFELRPPSFFTYIF